MDRCVLLSTGMWRFRSCPAAVLTCHAMTSESQSSWLDGDTLSRVQKTHILSYINSESKAECACFFPSMSAEKINCIWMNGHGGGVWWLGTGAERDLHMHAYTHMHARMLYGVCAPTAKQWGRANSAWQHACLRKNLFLWEISHSPSPFL